MKRIVIILFIIFVVPVWFVSCNRCGGVSGYYTWDDTKVTITNASRELLLENNDTVSTDSLYFNFHLTAKEIAGIVIPKFHYYSSMACEASDPQQKNYITNLDFKIKYLSQLDTFIPLIELRNKSNIYYEWPKDKRIIISELSHDDSNLEKLKCKLINPHNSKSAQIIITAIKLYGDTITTVSQNVFLK